MPSVSKKQARFMAAAAHNPKFAKKAGIKRSVAKEFNRADAGTGILKKAFGGVVNRAMGYAPRQGAIAQVVSSAMSRANPRRSIPTPPGNGPALASSKGSAFRSRNAGPIKPSITTEADQTLSEAGEGLRRTIGRIARPVMRRKEGGKVGSAMSALQQLAKQYKEALNLSDTEKATRIKRQMERLKPGSTKDLDAEAEEVGKEKAATFAKGGKVKIIEALRNHPMWSRSDYKHLKEKGYTDNDVKKFWDRDHEMGRGPVQHKKAPDIVGALNRGDE